jgi:hypothetical protein
MEFIWGFAQVVWEDLKYFGTTGGLFVCGPKPMLEPISNILETKCFYLGNYIKNFGNYIGKFVP